LLRLEGEVKVLEPAEEACLEHLLAKFVRKLPLRFERAEDRPFALFELSQLEYGRTDALDSLLVEPASLVAPVACDEGDGVTGVEQFDRAAHAVDGQLHLS